MRFKQVAPMKKKTLKTDYRVYSPSAMTNAYRAVLEENVPVKRAALTYGVPQTTLRQRVLGRVDAETTSSGPAPVLDQEEEAQFVEHLKSMASLGYGYTTNEVTSMASNYAISLKKRDEAHPFSMKWFRGFMKRWPELKVNKPRALANYRAKASSQATVTEYFERLGTVMDKFDLKDKPHCLYNVDEKGIQTEHSPPFIVSADKCAPAVTSSRSAITTILGCGNALGTMMPPFYIFKGKRLRGELLDGSMAGSAGTVTTSGWSNSDVFQEFLETHFLKYIQRGDESQTVLLLFDGHKSHVNVPVIEWAKLHNIELFVLPAHTSHILQPLDVGCFGPLQRIYNSACHKFIRNNPSSNITRYNVAELSSHAYELGLSPSNLKSAFKRTGIYPYNPSAIDSTKLTPATAFIPTTCDQPSQDNVILEKETSFFHQQAEVITHKRNLVRKERNTLSKITSGSSITDPCTVKQIEAHQETHKPVSTSKAHNQVSTSKRSLSQSSKGMKRKRSPPSTSKQLGKGISGSRIEPTAGPSGLQPIHLSDSEFTSESEIEDEEKCCVCHQFQPEELKHCVSLVFTKWAQCDIPLCQHWAHLKYCCSQSVVRRHDKFTCPCHAEE